MQETLDEWFPEYQDVYIIDQHTSQESLPKRDYVSTWTCACGKSGDEGYRFKSTLRTRVRGHQNCRCIR
nr:MAG: hypothetical protein [uncultured archaeon]